MVSLSYQKQLPFTASQLFNLVADIESYPDFLPYCLDLKLKSEQIRAGKRVRVAQIYVGYKLIKESFTTQVIEDEETYIISSSLISGPFSHLENKWQFEPRDVGEGAFVSLNLTYQFSNNLPAVHKGI